MLPRDAKQVQKKVGCKGERSYLSDSLNHDLCFSLKARKSEHIFGLEHCGPKLYETSKQERHWWQQKTKGHVKEQFYKLYHAL